MAELHAPYTLFEVSWEVCNKVGGIHTVVSTKAKTLVAKLGDDYLCIGPWLLSGGQAPQAFEEESGFEGFSERCRALGVPVRVGRWKIPGSPRTILVEFSGLYAKKDGILAGLWERFLVDSLSGEWDYVEPVLFGHAAAMVIEQWHEEHVAPRRGHAVAQFHEWMTGAGLLYLKEKEPSIGTVFTTHATMLGRSISSGGLSPAEGLAGRSPEAAAEAHNIKAKHSMESVCAREADVFTTVSGITADEAELFFHRRASPLLPNGIDLNVIDEIAGSAGAEEAEARLRDLARRFLGEDASDAALLCISGRYEFHNKGIDLLLEALAQLEKRAGRRMILFVLVPAGNSGVRSELLERLEQPLEAITKPLGICTHHLFDGERDPVEQYAKKLGLDNRLGARVKLIQIPIYLHEDDGFLRLPYEAVLRAMELSCFPSFYEPWGYTPEESLAVGVPTVTTDCAGFGRWAQENHLAPEDGVWLLPRVGVEQSVAAGELAARLETALAEHRERADRVRICRRTAQLTAWSDLIVPYEEAFSLARSAALTRPGGLAQTAFRPRIAVPANPAPHTSRPHLRRFDVATSLPQELTGLERLARNYWWCWDPEATALFRELFPAKWDLSRHNPVLFLRQIYPEDVKARAADPAYVKRLQSVLARFDAYMESAGRAREIGPGAKLDERHPVAYFSAEFGVHESLRIYSGGLGILAGDHLKSASDLGLPLLGVSLFYRFGYFQQSLTSSGEQLHGEIENDPRNLPLEPVLGENQRPLEIRLQLPSSELVLRAWKVAVGRVTLYLLDTNVPENRPEDRDITRTLYGGDHENRLRQEIVLGRGGKRLLSQLGIFPAVFHINEGHAAFLAVERVSRLVREYGLSFDEARVLVRSTTVFTTHTPVPAGHDRFAEDLMRRYFSDAPSWVGVPWERFYALGQGEGDKGDFNMTYLAMNFAGWVNGVSKLHGEVSRKLLHPFWPRHLECEVPVHSITNGVHLSTWVDPLLRKLLGASDRPLVAADYERRAQTLEPKALWDFKRVAKVRLLAHLRDSIERSFVSRHDSPSLLNRTLAGLDDNGGGAALWIGFARRFAPYKRASLLFRDLERLRRLFENAKRPLRIVFSGKAHPADKLGQELLKQVVALTRRDEFVGRVFFVEEYDIEMARALVQGVDVWLNNPIRPLEASGTSGMKVAANGGLNVSILDGWWPEAADGRNGWSIGGGRVYPDQALQDELDSDNLYRLLEDEVLPLFHERAGGLPSGWLERIAHSLESVPTVFNTDRMVEEYTERAYAPLAAAWHTLTAERFARVHAQATRQARIRKGFASVKVRAAHMSGLSEVRVGDTVSSRVEVELGALHERDLSAELVLGHKNGEGELLNPIFVPLVPVGREGAGILVLEAGHRMQRSGSFAYGIRLRPRPEGPNDLALADLMLWA
ncbi:MAG: alpha-glucan family phosphorylase [Planctomycetes bacterium]|nr:alpha-glucan family phosphorylase [Planctomycetota bacterium]